MKEKVWIVRTEDTYDGMSDVDMEVFQHLKKQENTSMNVLLTKKQMTI